MERAKFISAVVFSLVLLSSKVHGQLTELWQAGLTNTPSVSLGFGNWIYYTNNGPVTNYSPIRAAIDSAGNVFIAGRTLVYDTQLDGSSGFYVRVFPPRTSLFVVKFDNHGNKSWERTLEDPYAQFASPNTAIESVEADAHGNLFLTTRDELSQSRPYTLSKLAANDGGTLWQTIETNAVQGTDAPGSALKIDRYGNSFFVTLLLIEFPDGNYAHERFVTKYDRSGKRLWRTKLPGETHVLEASRGLLNSLALTETGEPIIVGSLRNGGYVAQLSSSGRIRWWNDGESGNRNPYFRNVMVGERKTICASAESYRVFLPNGRMIPPTRYHTPFYGEVVGRTPAGDFLLNAGVLFMAVDFRGQFRWFSSSGAYSTFTGLLSHTHGVLAANGADFPVAMTPLQLKCFDFRGKLLWQSAIPGFSSYNVLAFLKAPDGSIRIVLKWTDLSLWNQHELGVALVSCSIK